MQMIIRDLSYFYYLFETFFFVAFCFYFILIRTWLFTLQKQYNKYDNFEICFLLTCSFFFFVTIHNNNNKKNKVIYDEKWDIIIIRRRSSIFCSHIVIHFLFRHFWVLTCGVVLTYLYIILYMNEVHIYIWMM